MSVISRITTQKKHRNRYNIFLDDGHGEKYGFSVNEAVLIEYRLRKGLELDDAAISTLVKQDSLHKSYTLAISFLSYRMRTKKETMDYLAKKEVDEVHITNIMDRLQKEKLVDDEQFADAFVKTRIQTSSKGPRLIQQELLEKGVSAAIASSAAEQYTYGMQYEKAYKLAEKKLTSGSKKSFRQKLQQLQASLMQKGFDHDVIKDVLTEIDNQKENNAEWDALIYNGEKLLRKYQPKFSGFALQNKMKEALFRKGFSLELINRFLDEYENE
ncbi:regulatory protein RecX [Lentibacillus populi]|uniref:Regulatory protein RecX n=1 Tax=Lentibacillus populi TaxID=1827502 RepID=A0A9W5U0Z2_9BACI|nr:recombination regulator RecX [Lentibacillus populi]GGB57709.1 regulatory protein RecX [Lentibacillus populi]